MKDKSKNNNRVRVIKTILIIFMLVLALIPLVVDIYIGNEQKKSLNSLKIMEKKNDKKDYNVIDLSIKDPIAILYYFNKETPIYVNDPTMAKGATLVQNTDMLLGVKGQTSLLAAHSGLSMNWLFNDLNDFKIGDGFKVKNGYGEVFEYKVFDKKLVDPSDAGSVHRFKDKNVVVLITCYPRTTYAKRLLIYGERVNYDKKPEIVKAELEDEIKISRAIETKNTIRFRVMYVSILFAVILAFVLIS